MSHPKFEPTAMDREVVKSLVAVGTPLEKICQIILNRSKRKPAPITVNTLRKYFAEEISTAAMMANANVVGFLYQACKKGQGWAIKFWLQTRMREQFQLREPEVNILQLFGDINFDLIDFSRYTADELNALAAGRASSDLIERCIKDAREAADAKRFSLPAPKEGSASGDNAGTDNTAQRPAEDTGHGTTV